MSRCNSVIAASAHTESVGVRGAPRAFPPHTRLECDRSLPSRSFASGGGVTKATTQKNIYMYIPDGVMVTGDEVSENNDRTKRQLVDAVAATQLISAINSAADGRQ